MEPQWEAKIADPDLLRRVREGTAEPISVLVELELPPRTVEYGEREHAPWRRRYPKRVVPPSAGDEALTAQRTHAAGEYLASLLGKEPLWLSAAGAFVVEATSPQLQSIAEFPLTKAIHPNRMLK